MKDFIKRVFKFGVTGVLNTGVDYLVFTILAVWLSVNIYLAQTISYAAGTLNSYIINRSWTFRSNERFFSPTMIKFLVLNLCMLGLSVILIGYFTESIGLSKLIAKACTVLVTLAISFVINNFWVFKSKQTADDK